MKPPTCAGRILGVAMLLTATSVEAQVDVTELVRTQPNIVEALLRSDPNSSLSVRRANAASARGWVPITEHWSTLGAAAARRRLHALPTERERVFWSPPKKLLLDRARESVHLPEYTAFTRSLGVTAATGAGVVVGTVDSGVDFEHPDLRHPDGATRVAWFIDFADDPHGLYPELEEQFGCTGEEFSCGILSGSELDALLDGEQVLDASDRRVALATDRLGHGTHVTSLAAGNGAAQQRYAGVAPEATLIVARVASVTSSVSDAGVLMATRFVFDRADELAMPAVVNLSLGGDFGPHDGSSAIGLALEQLVEPPGRAIVVAAGNSGSLYASDSLPYPEPFGIHTEVHLPKGDSARIPLLLPRSHEGTLSGAIYVWIGAREADDISVGVETSDGDTLVSPVAPGRFAFDEGPDVTAVVLNQVSIDELPDSDDLTHGAALVLEGDFKPGTVYGVIVRGTGNAQLWVQSEGQLSPEISEGVVFPGATRSGTITIPGVSPELIAVGATVNRTTWPSRDDGTVELLELAGPWIEESPAFFSSDGPNRDGHPKPDILAPGVALVGAMGASADPLVDGDINPLSIFGVSNACEDSADCAVVSDEYAVTLGTSMAAPVVTGAVALLLEQEPTLTQGEILRLIVAGARQLPDGVNRSPQAAPGLLNIEASSRALAADAGKLELPEPSASSWLALSDALARPDPHWPIIVRLHLRDADGNLADAAVGDCELVVEHGRVLSVERVAPGLVQWEVAADEHAAGSQLRLEARTGSRVLARRSLPIAVDPNVARRGLSVRGGCALTSPRKHGMAGFFWVGVALGLAWRLLRRRRANAA